MAYNYISYILNDALGEQIQTIIGLLIITKKKTVYYCNLSELIKIQNFVPKDLPVIKTFIQIYLQCKTLFNINPEK